MTTQPRADSINIADAPPMTWRDVAARIHAQRVEIKKIGLGPALEFVSVILSTHDKRDLERDALPTETTTGVRSNTIYGLKFEFRDEISPREIVLRWEISA